MITLLGPPPRDLLERRAQTEQFLTRTVRFLYFMVTGVLVNQATHLGTFKHKDLLSDATLETEEEILEGDEKEKFLALIRRALQWRPEDRPSAGELIRDPWFDRIWQGASESSERVASE
jgi:serine/threonine protein kinase